MTEYLYQDITFDIRGACFWVWKEFGGAFKEKVVENALAVELQINFGTKLEIMRRVYEQARLKPRRISAGSCVDDQRVISRKAQ